jgi:hypothetical protein
MCTCTSCEYKVFSRWHHLGFVAICMEMNRSVASRFSKTHRSWSAVKLCSDAVNTHIMHHRQQREPPTSIRGSARSHLWSRGIAANVAESSVHVLATLISD